MLPMADDFKYDYHGCDLIYGRNCVDQLSEYLADHDLDLGMVVCGSNVSDNSDLMGVIKRGLGDRLVGVFDETTPEKQAETAFDVIDAATDWDADVLIGIGGGSSLDIARQASVFGADGRSLSNLRNEACDSGRISSKSASKRLPVIVIPTTFAGADISTGGSIEIFSAEESPTDQPVSASGSVMPIAEFADPTLFETTPMSALAGSAMNGFNKGIETLYARNRNPVNDATAVHGLRLLSEALPRAVGKNSTGDTEAMNRAVVGLLLVQIDRKTSIIHAFGHGFARRYSVQQGEVHAVVVPHVLRYLFQEVDANRSLLAEGFGINPDNYSDDELADVIIRAVTEIRDTFGVPTRLRELPETQREELPAIAKFIVDDPVMDRAPAELEPTVDQIETVLHESW